MPTFNTDSDFPLFAAMIDALAFLPNKRRSSGHGTFASECPATSASDGTVAVFWYKLCQWCLAKYPPSLSAYCCTKDSTDFWTPVRRTESPINSCLSVRPYVSNAFFSELVHLIFLIFCMKLVIHKCKKVTEPDFSGKFSFAQIWAKRAQKWTFFTFSQNSFISFFRYCARS